MAPAPLLAALAGMLAVGGAWEALAAVEQAAVLRGAARLLAPLRLAGRDGRDPSPPERRRLALVAAATLLAGGWLVAGAAAGIAAAAAGPWLAGRVVTARRGRWRAELGAAAPSAARAMADALSGGQAVRGAIAAAAGGGLPAAAAAELGAAARALALGARTEEVLERLRRRAADPRWDTIVAAMLLQRDAGGDLAGLLRSIAAAQEDAARVQSDARSLTSQARFTAWLVTLLPVAAAALAELARPGYLVSLAHEPLTAALVVAAATCQLTAGALVRRIARPEGS